MLGEQDLNPLGFHRHEPGARVPSMMAPTVALRDGAARGGARLRGLEPDPLGDPADARRPSWTTACRPRRRCAAPRIHVEGAEVEAEPRSGRGRAGAARAGRLDGAALAEQNLFFGGVQAVARNPDTGELSGGGDPRRGGFAELVD